MKYSLIKTIVFALLFVVSAPAFSQCFEIKSILVDACGEPEGFNEMVRFETGSAPLNTSALNVNWPSNPWKGLIQNAATANIVAQLNANIAAAGGCGQLIQPVGNTIPPNATVILFTSYVLNVSANEFGALSENIYVLFQNNDSTTSGHFANIGTGNRTLTMSVPGCNRSVTYNRALLPGGGDGDVVNFNNGVPSYDNNGCTAPVPVFDVDAGADQTTCPGTPVLLGGFAEGHTSLNWSAPSGTFSDPSIVNPIYTPDASATGTVILTLTMTGSCANTLTDTVEITIDSAITPDFPTNLAFCSGESVPALATTSPNGIAGTWSPSVINNTTSGTYVFTPDAGQCAASATLNVSITNSLTPNFPTNLAFCSGESVPALATTSPNGISGTWSPSVISNTTSGTYVFTPNAGQCAASATLNVSITPATPVVLSGPSAVCAGSAISLSADVNGGVWSSSNPAVATVDAAGIVQGVSGGTVTIGYAIPGGCASPATLTVVVGPRVIPQLQNAAICQSGQTVQLNTGLPATGYSFVWTRDGEVLTANGRSLTVSAPGQYTVVATHLSSGCSGTASAQVSVSAPLFASATIAQDFDRIQTISVQVAGGSGQFEFQLNDGPRQTSPYFSGYFDGEYTVTVFDLNGCHTLELTVFALNYPRFFTPNDDSFNDVWNIDGVQQGVIFIFDRYGKLLKQLRPGVGGWDGTFNGYALPATDYWFTLEYLNRDGDTKTFKSHFSLIR